MSVLAIGQRVRREEDFRLLTGRGRYVEDVAAVGPMENRRRAAMSCARRTRMHGSCRSTPTRARAAPGVLAVLTGAELERRGLGTLRPLIPRRKQNGAPAYVCPQPLLAQERVRYVGQPVAFIVAETLNQAKDAAELLAIEYEPLPSVTSAETALAPGAPAVWDDNPGNEAFTVEAGDRAATDAAFARAARIVRAQDRRQPGDREQHGAARLSGASTTATRTATRSAARCSRCTRSGRRWPGRSSACRIISCASCATRWAAASA